MVTALLIAVFAAFFAVYVYLSKRELAKAKADTLHALEDARASAAESVRLRQLYGALKMEADGVHAKSMRADAEAEAARIVGSARSSAAEILAKADADSKKRNPTREQVDYWAKEYDTLAGNLEKSEKTIDRLHAELIQAHEEKLAALQSLAGAGKNLDSIRVQIEKWSNACAVMAERFIREYHAMLVKDMTSSNYATSAAKLDRLMEFLEKNQIKIDEGKEALHAELKAAFEKAARAEAAREEQRRIKALMREEIALQREREAELKRLAAQEKAVREALAKAEAEHSGEVERLRSRLGELEGAIVRAKSQAELTKAGHVYVLSNIGSFGEGVFKVGMTRRLEPLERVTELGDASVPFPFDVHMLISCEDAPALENALHRALNAKRLNKVNLRKEFFRTDLVELAALVESSHGKVEYVAEPEALQYRDSQAMTEADFAFVAGVQSQPEEDVSEN